MYTLKAQPNIFSSFLLVVSMAVRMGVGRLWEQGDKKKRKKREDWFCLCGCGKGGTVGVSLSNEKYCVVRKSYTLYPFLKKIHTHTKQIIIFFFTFENMLLEKWHQTHFLHYEYFKRMFSQHFLNYGFYTILNINTWTSVLYYHTDTYSCRFAHTTQNNRTYDLKSRF